MPNRKYIDEADQIKRTKPEPRVVNPRIDYTVMQRLVNQGLVEVTVIEPPPPPDPYAGLSPSEKTDKWLADNKIDLAKINI